MPKRAAGKHVHPSTRVAVSRRKLPFAMQPPAGLPRSSRAALPRPCPRAGMGSASELEVNDLWFSLAVESDVLAGGKGAKPLTGETPRLHITAL